MPRTILATGAAGFIGSHVCVELMAAGYAVVVLDNFSNSHPEAVRRVAALGHGTPALVEGDVRDPATLDRLFSHHAVDAVIHLAGLKAVGESTEIPDHYYDVNVGGTVRLCQAMIRHGVGKLVFSSSATVYGDPATTPIREDFPTGATNPYGRSKLMIEQIITDVAAARADWEAISLRYFNPVGAHASGTIGEDPRGIPNNLFPYIAQVAVGRRDRLRVFGNDYPTHDGTGVRDYIHVVDLARGHVAALDFLFSGRADPGRHLFVNLGTGRGYSVLDVVGAWSAAVGRDIPYEIVGRRPGDIATCYADPTRARDLFGWTAEHGIAAMCRDHWRWQRANPEGYAGAQPARALQSGRAPISPQP